MRQEYLSNFNLFLKRPTSNVQRPYIKETYKLPHFLKQSNNQTSFFPFFTHKKQYVISPIDRLANRARFDSKQLGARPEIGRPLQPFKIFQQRLLSQHKRQNTFTLIYDSFVILSIYAFYVFNTLNALLRRVFSLSYTARIPRRRGNRELYSWFYRRFLYTGTRYRKGKMNNISMKRINKKGGFWQYNNFSLPA
jgi:hypothetical protein